MSEPSTGQVNTRAAEIYDEFFLPALFGPWAGRVAGAAQLRQRVLDVACGTGVLSRAAASAVEPGGSVVGVDINPGMLAVAGRKAPHIRWEAAPAESLPFDDDAFDRVVSQFGLMFFGQREQAVAEMLRVLRPGGRLVVAVWASLDDTPGYAAITVLLQRLFGAEVADELRAPYSLGDPAALRDLFAGAGADDPRVETLAGTARFPSLESWIYTDIKGWTLADRIDERQYETLQREAPAALSRFVAPDGSVRFDSPAHLVIAAKA